MSQATRFADQTATVTRTQEQILDRVELLMIAKGEDRYSKGRVVSMMNVF